MGQRYLIDTNTLINYLKAELPIGGQNLMQKSLSEGCSISFISQIEILCYNEIPKEQIVKIQNLIKLTSVLKIDDFIILKTIEIRKNHNLKLPDAILAATASVTNFTLVTRNEKDFSKVPGLKVVNPFAL